MLAFAVSQRTGEFGVRMAIGADAAHIRRQVLGDGARLVGLGLGIGVLGAISLGFVLRNQLFGVGAVDAAESRRSVLGVLAVTALVACWLPARRAARSAPLEALALRIGGEIAGSSAMLSDIWHDMRYAARRCSRAPGSRWPSC